MSALPNSTIGSLSSQEIADSAIRNSLARFRATTIGGKRVLIPPPVEAPTGYRFVGREKELFQLLAALEATLNPVVISEAGQGKTTAAMQVAEMMGRELYLVHGHEDLNAENLLVELLPTAEGFEYVVQPLLAAVLSGGIVAVDEINRLNEAALASLHGLLDGRRTVCSSILGMRFEAHPDFRLFGLANPFSSPLPPAADQRLRPVFHWENYTVDEMLFIIGETEDLGKTALDTAFKAALVKSGPLSLRSALTVLRFARGLHRKNPAASPTSCVETAMETVAINLFTEERGTPCD